MFSIKNILRSSYEFYLSKFVTLIGITAVVYFLSVLFEYVVDSIFSVSFVIGTIIGVVMAVVGIVFEIGYLKYLLKLASGVHSSVEDLLKYSYLIWRYVLGWLAYAAVVVVGLILFIVPGVYLSIRFMFVPILIVDKELTIKEAFNKSTLLTQGVKWKLFGLILILGLIMFPTNAIFSGSEYILQGAFIVLVSPFVVVAYIKVYRFLLGLE